MIKEEAVGMMEQENGGVKVENITNPTSGSGFEAMEEEEMEKDMWQPENDHLLDMNDASIFYDDFPPLPDFPCMSSSSSSSSAPAVAKPTATATSYSSSASSSVMKSNAAAGDSSNQMRATLSSTASMDCIDVMENFGYMDLIDSYDIWDPSSVFQNENPQDFMEDQPAAAAPGMEGQKMVQCEEEEEDENENGLSFIQENGELALIFFEWLKQNKDYISAEDMRSIKLKRSTIESASKRLGSTKEGKKQLLKLILGWVEQCQLSKKKTKETAPQTPYPFQQESVHNPDFNPNPNPNFTYTNTFAPPDPNTGYPASPWMPPPPPPHVPDAATMVAAPQPAFSYPVAGYNNVDPYLNPVFAPPVNQVVNGVPYPHSGDQYPMMDNSQSWAPSPFPMPPPPLPQYSPFCDTGNVVPYQQAFYGHPYPIYDPNGERIVTLGSSATKEARKKRMARQRRHYTHHHRHHSNSYQHQGQMDDSQFVGEGGENCEQGEGDWAYWSPGASSSPSRAGITPPVDASSQPHSGDRATGQSQNNQRPSERRPQQGWKTEKNLKFLLQKVLKQSDVGNLGRIVLPKKEAESHLPELESRDGIPIAMEDIGTSRVWNMRYRFWPNNKSRMYLLENTGDFVRVNGLQEGDFIVIYSDTKCGKYMIRGVKVRQPGAKLEGKKMSRRNARSLSLAGNCSSLAPIKQAVR